MNEQPSFPDEAALRARAVEIARHACNGDTGRVLGDPVFELVTEGRCRSNPRHSGCGDLCHFVLQELGVRDERIVNRTHDGGSLPWRVGVNLGRLVFSTGKAFVWARPGLRPKPGDILYVALPEHVAVLEWLDEEKGEIATFDYGQRLDGLPAGKRRVSPFRVTPKKLYVGTRVLKGWLDIARLPGLLPPPEPPVVAV